MDNDTVEIIWLTGKTYKERIKKYEQIVGMTGEELLKKEKLGEVPDTFEAKYLSILLKMGG